MGSDAFLEIKLWHKWEEFLDLVNILVLTRPDSKIDKNSNIWDLISDRKISDIKLLKGSGKIMILNIDPINISSTQVRSNIFKGKSVDNLIIEEVVDYIDEGKLYT
jgi:nicotinate-nucleotide adenylyltransferase